jgi:hypothetical protein
MSKRWYPDLDCPHNVHFGQILRLVWHLNSPSCKHAYKHLTRTQFNSDYERAEESGVKALALESMRKKWWIAREEHGSSACASLVLPGAWWAWRVCPWHHASIAAYRSWSVGLYINKARPLPLLPFHVSHSTKGFGSELRGWWLPCSKSYEPIVWNKTNWRMDLKVLSYNNFFSVVDGNGARTLIILKFLLYYYAVVTLASSHHVCCDRFCEMQDVVG